MERFETQMKHTEKQRKVNFKENSYFKQVSRLLDKAAPDRATESQKVYLGLRMPT